MTLPEVIVRHERRVLSAALVAIPVLCWAWIVPMARDMNGAMAGPSAWMMTRVWDARHTSLLSAMWITMMIGMMLPSVAPVLLLYAGVMRSSPDGARAALRVYPMAAGYLLVWTGFSVVVTLLQRALGEFVLTPMMTLRSSLASAALLLVAAVYQLTPLKQVCLDSCRAPIAFVLERMRPGVAGAFRLGVEHGVYCVGCCWALMLLMFVVLLEKLEPFGLRTRQLNAAGLVGAAVWIMVR